MPLKVFQGPFIRAGQFQSDVLALGDDFIVGMATPDDWTPAIVSVMVSPQGDNFYDLYDGAGREFVFNVTKPGCMIRIDPNLLLCAAFIRLRSGTADNPIIQKKECRFYLIGTQKTAI